MDTLRDLTSPNYTEHSKTEQHDPQEGNPLVNTETLDPNPNNIPPEEDAHESTENTAKHKTKQVTEEKKDPEPNSEKCDDPPDINETHSLNLLKNSEPENKNEDNPPDENKKHPPNPPESTSPATSTEPHERSPETFQQDPKLGDSLT